MQEEYCRIAVAIVASQQQEEEEAALPPDRAVGVVVSGQERKRAAMRSPVAVVAAVMARRQRERANGSAVPPGRATCTTGEAQPVLPRPRALEAEEQAHGQRIAGLLEESP